MIINLFDVVNRYRDVNLDVATAPSIKERSFESSLISGLFNEIYVFGDSLSDIGNAFDATRKGFKEGLPPAPPYIQGRFSNGAIWVEYLAQLLGLTSKRKTNYAIGGANTGNTNTFIPNNPLNLPGLQQQFTSFKTQYPQADREALYIIWAGANDYLSGSLQDSTQAIANLSNGVKLLATLGAKNIMVVNLPDLGKLPATRQDPQVSKFLSDITQKHNSGLAESLKALSQSLGNCVNIIQFDVYSLFNQVFASPQKFGFTVVTNSELEQLSQLQGYTEEFFFWDDIHPTTAVHKLLAKYAFEVLSAKNKLYLLVEN
ncbi:SGNH/GDSL hydrolase family protein [Iningainema tapete]|uniref:SGNH/GDSL hydrolase family protein n=1 Tax=Iningainema tapete BLCC-T55 TaxID=2748662 RepID=A0A8J7BWE4_9CYAN|nr:SGNH/GDSL hydrolase family protein [Iningainema tapete]MBD2770793.1 SGNH/GDSL hydrolase family protein [Iningainema tapete BLCC-T55]